MKIGLLIIATNKYAQFVEPLISTADKYFLPNEEVTYFIFTNQNIDIKTERKYIKVETEHSEWPWMTLGRYKIFSNSSEILKEMDYLYYCDADMRFENLVGQEILSDLVVTQHHGYYMMRGTPETDLRSLACVRAYEEMQYFAGGFNGGTSESYLKMAKQLSENIDIDYSNGIIAVWHDESHLNRYVIDNKPTKVLDPGYCFFENNMYDIRFEKKLLALVKDHSEYRK